MKLNARQVDTAKHKKRSLTSSPMVVRFNCMFRPIPIADYRQFLRLLPPLPIWAACFSRSGLSITVLICISSEQISTQEGCSLLARFELGTQRDYCRSPSAPNNRMINFLVN
jgi:hypothetical protein